MASTHKTTIDSDSNTNDMKRLIPLALLGLVFLVSSVPAHEFWIQSAKYFLSVGDSTALGAYVGENFTGDTLEFRPERIVSLTRFSKSGRTELLSMIPTKGEVHHWTRFNEPGTVMFAYASNGKFVELDSTKFTDYLEEEGLDTIIRMRERLKATGLPGRELFHRCAKAIVQVGPARDTTYAIATGMRLDIVPEQHPYSLKPGDMMGVRVLFDGAPVANGLLIFWNNENGRQTRIRQRTDAGGRASIRLFEPGVWMISLVHMIPHPVPSEADWASYWGNVTFELGR